MTNEEIMVATSEDIEARMAEIKVEIETPTEETNLEALSAELTSIEERKKALAEERKNDIQNVVDEIGTTETKIEFQEERKMTDIMEIRKSQAYVDAFAEYIKTNDDTECRALLTELAPSNGQVPVPVIVDEEIKTAWSKSKLLDLVKKTYIKGILKVGFELSATGAVVHVEGSEAPAEETLTLGIVELKPESIKKWITISDEVIGLKGEAFVRYIYAELTYQISKAAESALIAMIEAAPAASTATKVGVPVVPSAADMATVAKAISALSDKAENPVIVMNKASYATFKALQLAGNFAADPFEGLTVIYNNDIKSVDAAGSGDTYMIVGDFGIGAQANFPEGEEIRIKFDDLSLAEKDLVKIVGREYVGLGLVAPNAIVKVQAV